VHLTVRFPGLSIDQIRFTVTPASADPIIARRPELTDAAVSLRSPQDVLVYLPDYMAGRVVTCEATGMQQGSPTPATGAADATLKVHELADAVITLAGSTPDPPDAATPPERPCHGKACGD
jgi:hypothetical protein